MNDDLVKRLRDGVGMQVGAWPMLIHKAADRMEALEEEVGVTRTEKHADAECIGALEAAIDAAITKLDASPIMNAHICEAKRILRTAREATK